MSFGSSVPSVPGASIRGTSARSRCAPSTVGFAPCSWSVRTMQPPTRIENEIQRAESNEHYRNSNRLTKQSEMENSEHPSSRAGQDSGPLRLLCCNRWRRLERRPRPELLRLAIPVRLPSLVAALGFSLCRLLLRSRHLERHPRRSGFLPDGPQLRFATRHLGSFGHVLLSSLDLPLQPPLPAGLHNCGIRGFGIAPTESCDRRSSADRGGPLVSRYTLVWSGASNHIDSGVQALWCGHDDCRPHSGIHRNPCSIPSPFSRPAYSRRRYSLRRAVTSKRRFPPV